MWFPCLEFFSNDSDDELIRCHSRRIEQNNPNVPTEPGNIQRVPKLHYGHLYKWINRLRKRQRSAEAIQLLILKN